MQSPLRMPSLLFSRKEWMSLIEYVQGCMLIQTHVLVKQGMQSTCTLADFFASTRHPSLTPGGRDLTWSYLLLRGWRQYCSPIWVSHSGVAHWDCVTFTWETSVFHVLKKITFWYVPSVYYNLLLVTFKENLLKSKEQNSISQEIFIRSMANQCVSVCLAYDFWIICTWSPTTDHDWRHSDTNSWVSDLIIKNIDLNYRCWKRNRKSKVKPLQNFISPKYFWFIFTTLRP